MVAVHRPSTKCKLHDPPFCIFQTSWLLSNSVRGEGSHPSTALRKPDVEPESDLRVIRAPPVSLVRVTQVAGLASPTPSTLEFSFSTVPAILSGLAAQPSPAISTLTVTGIPQGHLDKLAAMRRGSTQCPSESLRETAGLMLSLSFKPQSR